MHVTTKERIRCWAGVKSTECAANIAIILLSTLIRKRGIFVSSLPFVLASSSHSRSIAPCASVPLCVSVVRSSPLISIRQMDVVVPIILMWTCWKLERNVQISAPFYWKYHQLFTSKTKFHSSLVYKKIQYFIFYRRLLGLFSTVEIGLFLSLSSSHSLSLCVETHTESGKIFALFAPSKI